MNSAIEISFDDSIKVSEVVGLYAANGWSSARKPDELVAALRNSHSLVTARLQGKLVGIANAISDGHLVVYYPRLAIPLGFTQQSDLNAQARPSLCGFMTETTIEEL